MNLDDESFLSAYLDDELDPAERLAIEWSVESSPPLADQLRSLATARDAVNHLSRPAIPTDLASAIVSRIAADRRRARLQALARPGRIALTVTGLSAMAASLLFALLLVHRSTHEGFPDLTVVQQVPLDSATRNHPSPDPIELKSVSTLSVPLPDSEVIEPLVSVDETRATDDRAKVTRMLESPDVRLILIVTDQIDAADRVQSLISQDARKNPLFGRISLKAGIVIDPKHPESAEVFAVPIVEGGRSSFLNHLRSEFGDLVDEGEPSPDLVTQLTEVGHVTVLEGTHASPLGQPPGEAHSFLAIRPAVPLEPRFEQARIVPLDGVSPLPGPVAASSTDRPGGSKDSSDPGRFFVGPPYLPPRADDPRTLLVWVTRPPKS